MVTKRVSPEKRPTRRKVAVEVPVLTESVAGTGIDTKGFPALVPTGIDPNVRRQLVAAEAYFLAERRGFRAGGEIEDWVAAEAVVDSRLRQVEAA